MRYTNIVTPYKRGGRERFRLQNSPYFAYSSTHELSNKRSGTRLKMESETGERRSPHALRLARFARVRLFGTLYRFWEKNRLFCSLGEIATIIKASYSPASLENFLLDLSWGVSKCLQGSLSKVSVWFPCQTIDDYEMIFSIRHAITRKM